MCMYICRSTTTYYYRQEKIHNYILPVLVTKDCTIRKERPAYPTKNGVMN